MKKIGIIIALITLAAMLSTVAFAQGTRKTQRQQTPAPNKANGGYQGGTKASQDVFVTEVVSSRKPNSVSVMGVGGGVDERSAADAPQPQRRARNVPAPTPSPITKRPVPRPI